MRFKKVLNDKIIGEVIILTRNYLTGRKLLFGSNQSTGVATTSARRGDHVCTLIGCRTPITLRPVDANSFQFAGACCIDGVSHGEAIIDPFSDNIHPVRVGSQIGDRWGYKDENSGKTS
ncbi:hypothetical protein BKA67DRAFT_190341 [Truncatella angustata]|uniref:Uncharacterized protein n=1 Tax=Truncatella angustata TaxID=152316 RepID=A0A9P8USM1_9PEZI|nr:uncharacterized protein BKA67DRAFT_190341 [Truncatella angustata]KAH6657503.1 hypothetical protein BKA67DRAFT_190341 [Truncatella angustata]